MTKIEFDVCKDFADLFLFFFSALTGSSVLLQRAISSEVATHLSAAWTPPFLKEKGIRSRAKLPGWQREVLTFENLK